MPNDVADKRRPSLPAEVLTKVGTTMQHRKANTNNYL